MAKPYKSGTRVVLVEDHRCASLGVTSGMTGEVVSFYQENEKVFWMGSYCILFNHNTGTVWVNASAVARWGNGYSDNDLVMAGDLANLLDAEWPDDEWLEFAEVASWLREQVVLELKARVR